MNLPTVTRLTPSEILNYEYSDIAFCGYDKNNNELYEKLNSTPAEKLPSLGEVTEFTSQELIHLAHRIADAYKFYLLAATEKEKNALVNGELEYKIKVKASQNSTTQSLSLRVSDRKWWRRQIIKLADETREHIAQSRKILGGKKPTQVCCSDATVQMYRERKGKTDEYLKSQYKIVRTETEDPFIFNLYEISENSKSNRLNEIFLDIKALERIAEKNDFGCVFITLTAAANFHSNPKFGKDRYDGSTAREANKALQKDWRSIQDSLDNKNINRNSGEYFGFRVVELHEDGCPHWHILFFYKKESEILETVLNSIERLYEDRSNYFDHHKSDIVRIIEKKDDSTATPSSYIFKYIAFALAGDNDELALKYKCAIRSMGARQYSFFGIKCALGKQRALKRIAKKETAPKKIKELARALHQPTDSLDRNAKQLAARVAFFEGDSNLLIFEKENVVNRYGETTEVVRHVKHISDDESVQVSGLCEDISKEKAEALKARQMTPSPPLEKQNDEVTIVINYSSKSKEQERELSPVRFRSLAQDQSPQRGLYSAQQTLNAFALALPQRMTMSEALKSLEQRRSVYYKFTSPPTEMEVEQDDEKFEKIGLMILERRRLNDFKKAA